MADFIGAKNLYLAEITEDSETVYTVGTPFRLSRIAEISQTTEQAQNVVYYDNVAAYAVNSEGATTISVTCEGLTLENIAKITGRTIDADTGVLLDDGEARNPKFALLFQADFVGSNGSRYYAFHNVTLSIPDEASKTKDAGTDTINQTLTVTCVNTTHKFTKGNNSSKKIVYDTTANKLNVAKWFETVITPDNLEEFKNI